MNPPERVPAEIEHDEEVKRPPGTAVRRHVVPAKFEPETVTDVPTGPDVGLNERFGGGGTLNDACPVSPVVPATLTVYEPLVPDATVNDPDIASPATVHSGFEMRPLGVEEIVHPTSPAAKFEPEMRTFVLGRPEAGSNEIPGSTVKLVVAPSINAAPLVPFTTTVHPPTVAVVPFTVKDPETVPPEIAHVAAYVVLISPVGLLVILHPVSFRLKLLPVTVIVLPRGPELGETAIVGLFTVKIVVILKSVAAAWAGVGAETEYKETNSEERSNISRYVELTLRAGNSKHATKVSRVFTI